MAVSQGSGPGHPPLGNSFRDVHLLLYKGATEGGEFLPPGALFVSCIHNEFVYAENDRPL